ncbi:MAG: hypothetical protein ACRDP7_28605 [Trebonia sp.]
MTAEATPATPYLAPEVGFEALKDATALIKCIAAGDDEGHAVIANGSPHPRRLAGMVASIAVTLCRRVGLSDAAIDLLLADISAQYTDFLLDQQTPAGEVTSHR